MCNTSAQKLNWLKTQHPNLVKSFIEMADEDLKSFVKANAHLTGAALEKLIRLKVNHIRQLREEELAKKRRVPQALSVLKQQGFTDEHLKAIEATCESEWNPEIKDRMHCNCNVVLDVVCAKLTVTCCVCRSAHCNLVKLGFRCLKIASSKDMPVTLCVRISPHALKSSLIIDHGCIIQATM